MSSEGFDKDYWEKNYSDPDSMDCIANRDEHVQYLKYLFAIEYIDISSIIDFGYGMGHLFSALMKEFIPYKAHGIEPSKYIFEKAEVLPPVESTKLELENIDLVTWAQSKKKKHQKRFDLGVCTSVFQYLTEEELDIILPKMAERVKYLYLSVPTDIELQRQVSDLEFHDEFAIRRSREFYQEKLKKYFTVVSARVLESKIHFNEEDTFFTDLLYRF